MFPCPCPVSANVHIITIGGGGGPPREAPAAGWPWSSSTRRHLHHRRGHHQLLLLALVAARRRRRRVGLALRRSSSRARPVPFSSQGSSIPILCPRYRRVPSENCPESTSHHFILCVCVCVLETPSRESSNLEEQPRLRLPEAGVPVASHCRAAPAITVVSAINEDDIRHQYPALSSSL